MKKIIRVPYVLISSVLVLIIAVCLVYVISYFVDNAGGQMKYQCELYFLNSMQTELEPEIRDIKYRDKANLCVKAVETLIKGPDSNNLKPILNSKTKFLTIDMNDEENIIANFNSEFLTGDSTRDILSVYSVVKTLCSIQGINSVKVTVEGANVTDSKGVEIGALTAEDINLISDTNQYEWHDVTLYFTKKGSDRLYKETRKVKITDQLPLAQHVVQELIKGPENTELTRCISRDSGLISVNISGNKCYVNFKKSFITKNSGSAESEKLALYSVVNSLCELDSVVGVQFLIEGKKVTNFGDIVINTLLEYDESLVDGI